MFPRIRPGLSVVIARLSRALRHGIRFAVRLTTRQPGMLVGVLAIVILWSGVLYAVWAKPKLPPPVTRKAAGSLGFLREAL